MKKLILLAISFALCTTFTANAKPKTLWMIGDATMAEYPDSTLAYGWGTAFEQYIHQRISLVNLADTGMSAKVFVETGLIENMEKKRNRSYILLQFGANDLKEYALSQYSSTDAMIRHINKIVSIARQNRINVILCTPLALPFYKEGKLIDRLGGYPDAIRHLAEYHHLPLLDLEQTTRTWLMNMTEDEAAAYYVTVEPTQLSNGEYQLNKEGAETVAQLAKDFILNGKSKKLKRIIKK